MKKKHLSLVSLMLALVLMLTACGSGNKPATEPEKSDTPAQNEAVETPEKGEVPEGMVDTSAFKKDGPYTIGFSNISVVNTFRVQMVRELEYAAEQAGVTLYTTDAGGDTAKQVSDIQDLMARGIDALLVAPGSTTVTNAVTKKAIDQGIPVIVFNSEVDDENAFTGYVGTDAVEFGYVMSKWLLNELNGEGNIIVLNGTAGAGVGEMRYEGLQKALDEMPDGGKNINILATYYADWAYDKGKQAVEQALAAYPEIDGVWSQGGAMTQGAIEAFQAAGRDLVPMTGEDSNGFLKLWKEAQDDGFRSIAASDAAWQGQVALDTALQALAGETIQKYNYIPVPTITDADIDQYVRPEYSDAYWCNSKMTKEVADQYYLE